jgi:hypothetical protein
MLVGLSEWRVRQRKRCTILDNLDDARNSYLEESGDRASVVRNVW